MPPPKFLEEEAKLGARLIKKSKATLKKPFNRSQESSPCGSTVSLPLSGGGVNTGVTQTNTTNITEEAPSASISATPTRASAPAPRIVSIPDPVKAEPSESRCSETNALQIAVSGREENNSKY